MANYFQNLTLPDSKTTKDNVIKDVKKFRDQKVSKTLRSNAIPYGYNIQGQLTEESEQTRADSSLNEDHGAKKKRVISSLNKKMHQTLANSTATGIMENFISPTNGWKRGDSSERG